MIPIHNYKITDWLYEQPTDIKGVYCDYRIKKCTWCGKTKQVIDKIYYADRLRVPLYSFPDISFLTLGNKVDIIPKLF